MRINPKLQLLQLPLDIKHYTQKIINSHQFQQTVNHLESDLLFWFHTMDVDYEWWISAHIHGYIEYPHPRREMKVPVYLRAPRVPRGYRAIFLDDQTDILTAYNNAQLELYLDPLEESDDFDY